ncbi:MAG: DUF4159 domain-containing protein [Gemmatimonadetes bacterium]|nr:DUF4159 domain-containing protein [Gemmatimonadota bacterium]
MRLFRSTPRLALVASLTASQVGGLVPRSEAPRAVTSPSLPAVALAGGGAPTEWVTRARQRGRPCVPVDVPASSHEFFFTRAMYSGYRRRGFGRGSWAIDCPEADQHFLFGLRRMTNIDAYDGEHPMRLDDPELRKFPFLYMLEVGAMALSPPEIEGLRSYLLAGGFLFVDDFWGDWEWLNFEQQIRLVLPEYSIQEIGLDHPVFNAFYDIDTIIQVPNVGNGRWGGGTSEKGGITPHVRGIFDEHGRLLVAVHWNTDLGDAWEWADDPYYPIFYSNYAWRVGINFVIYAMTH